MGEGKKVQWLPITLYLIASLFVLFALFADIVVILFEKIADYNVVGDITIGNRLALAGIAIVIACLAALVQDLLD